MSSLAMPVPRRGLPGSGGLLEFIRSCLSYRACGGETSSGVDHLQWPSWKLRDFLCNFCHDPVTIALLCLPPGRAFHQEDIAIMDLQEAQERLDRLQKQTVEKIAQRQAMRLR